MIEFEILEMCFVFNVYCKIELIVFVVCNDVYKFIEECMILVNVLVVCLLEKYEVSVFYCVYDEFDVEKLGFFWNFLLEFGIEVVIFDELILKEII